MAEFKALNDRHQKLEDDHHKKLSENSINMGPPSEAHRRHERTLDRLGNLGCLTLWVIVVCFLEHDSTESGAVNAILKNGIETRSNRPLQVSRSIRPYPTQCPHPSPRSFTYVGRSPRSSKMQTAGTRVLGSSSCRLKGN